MHLGPAIKRYAVIQMIGQETTWAELDKLMHLLSASFLAVWKVVFIPLLNDEWSAETSWQLMKFAFDKVGDACPKNSYWSSVRSAKNLHYLNEQ